MAWKGSGAGFCITRSPTVPSLSLEILQNNLPTLCESWNLDELISTYNEKRIRSGSPVALSFYLDSRWRHVWLADLHFLRLADGGV